MILDESGLTWRRVFEERGPRGELCIRHDCVEHPRLYRLWQVPNQERGAIECYFVAGIEAQHWHTAAEALAAMWANP